MNLSKSSDQSNTGNHYNFHNNPNDIMQQLLTEPYSMLLNGDFTQMFSNASNNSIIMSTPSSRNSSKTLKCPKCNWHYKYQETLEIHMKEKHSEIDVDCLYCTLNSPHPKLARGESYSCGYKPYRCEICKYSTTTKGNLSIHMQSDKHLHAVQEIPINNLNMNNNNSGNHNSLNSLLCSTTPNIDNDPLSVTENNFQCLICGNFSSTSITKMLRHIEEDRSGTTVGDINVIGGLYQCNLCPYSTNLKANFQLHTRTDKHLQRVQIVNHMRESNQQFVLGPSTLSSLNTIKSTVQVRCRCCQELFSSSSAFKEHTEGQNHQSRLNMLVNSSSSNTSTTSSRTNLGDQRSSSSSSNSSDGQVNGRKCNEILKKCKYCNFTTNNEHEQIEHISNHSHIFDLTNTGTKNSMKITTAEAPPCQSTNLEISDDGNEGNGEDSFSNDLSMKLLPKDSRLLCPECIFSTESPASYQAHISSNQHLEEDKQLLEYFLKGEKLDRVEVVARSQYKHCCSNCQLAFKQESDLNIHKIEHLFNVQYPCNKCSEVFDTKVILEDHISNTHFYCELCGINFEEKHQLSTHHQSLSHLERAKKMLEEKSSNFSLSDEVKQALSKTPPSCEEDSLPNTSNYRCNICNISYASPSALDAHLNSLSHQLQLNRLPEMVSNGEVCPDLQLYTTPESNNDNNCKSIGQTLLNEKAFASMVIEHQQQQQNAFAMFNMLGGFNSIVNNNGGTVPKTSTHTSGENSSQSMTTGVDFVKMLDQFGLETILSHLNFTCDLNILRTKIARLSKETVGDICQVRCDICQNEFSSLLSLKIHYQQIHSTDIPTSVIENFTEKLKFNLELLEDKENSQEGQEVIGQSSTPTSPSNVNLKRKVSQSPGGEMNQNEGNVKRSKDDSCKKVCSDNLSQNSSTSSSPNPEHNKNDSIDESNVNVGNANSLNMDINTQMNMMQMLVGMPCFNTQFFNMINNQDISTNSLLSSNPLAPSTSSLGNSLNSFVGLSNAGACSPQKRARTRISDDQLKVLRQYFDINNSPSEAQIKDMSIKTSLPEKVIKHWFRNTLFKERQRDKDSPYNFSVPPQVSIDLDTYEKTGEAKIVSLKDDNNLINTPTNVEDDDEEESLPTNEEKASNNKGIETNLKSSVSLKPKSINNLSSTNNTTTTTTTSLSSPLSANNLPVNVPSQLPNKSNNNSNSNSGGSNGGGNNNISNTGTPLSNNILEAYANNPFVTAAMNPFALFFQNSLRNPNDLLPGLNTFNVPSGNMNSPSTGNVNSSLNSTASMVMTSASGRRANRTRFTDHQLRTLQNFFERQAYPKDDDLEMLSKKLQLSPRVIVVWFQNARQKARKIYESHPGGDNAERFVRTPGCNFQCKRCDLVFQRYYELIQHQQKVCYKGDRQALKSDNKSVEEGLSEEDRAEISNLDNIFSITNSENNDIKKISNNNIGGILPDELLKIFTKDKKDNDGMLKFCKNKEKESLFRKRCPSCSTIFTSKEQLLNHITTSHADQPHMFLLLNVDLLPDVVSEENDETMTVNNPTSLTTDPLAFLSTFPLNLASLGNVQSNNEGNNSEGDDSTIEYSLGNSVSPASYNRSPRDSSVQRNSPNSIVNNSKRFRTHLTPQQVHVMKCIFNEYKTPSMPECEIMGSHIGLHKRVVQVWFQNARAKERKSRNNADDGNINFLNSNLNRCDLCNVNFNQSNTSLQDHIFTKEHIQKIKSTCDESSNNDGNNSSNDFPQFNNLLENLQSKQSSSGVVKKQIGGLNFDASTFSMNFMNSISGTQLPNVFCDPNIFGTPIDMLQVSKSVVKQIKESISNGLSSTTFTQDGLPFSSLESVISSQDFKVCKSLDIEVGWACPKCTNVFQSEAYLKNHQSILCQGCTDVFKLIQTHIECIPCDLKFGPQAEYKIHCDSSSHIGNRSKY
ncbi:Zinc finger protein 2 [Strongyloides ratti]|uniref:Zinc finger protein 2 n=1 Tax=Strongyloides ratti TaxID=34506 RepID=A0A090L5A6_STRRB|nr:Zinc finger protein 2 [Strongyloides ratti]CEF64986.1 Zinc finger protein 2 [Strongyloides ratti]